jgi:Ferritin-like domain
MAATRRELLRGGLVAGAAAAGADGALAALTPAAQALTAPGQVEARALAHTLEIEQLLVVAYRQALRSGVVHPPVKGQLQTHLAQELEHVALLERTVMRRGMIVPPAPNLEAAQDDLARHQVHWSLTNLRSQHDCLKLLVDVESLAENAYFQAVEKLQDLALVRTCAEVMACEAQHWTVLSGFLNHRNAMKAVPYPFVEGTP